MKKIFLKAACLAALLASPFGFTALHADCAGGCCNSDAYFNNTYYPNTYGSYNYQTRSYNMYPNSAYGYNYNYSNPSYTYGYSNNYGYNYGNYNRGWRGARW